MLPYHVAGCLCLPAIGRTDQRCADLTAKTLRGFSTALEDLERQFRACAESIRIYEEEQRKQSNELRGSIENLQYLYTKRYDVMNEKITQLHRDSEEMAKAINHNAVLLDIVSEKSGVTTRATRVRS